MKVLHVINCFARSGGAEKLVLDLTLALKSLGVEVEILSLVEPSDENKDFIYIAQAADIRVYTLTKGNLYSVSNIIKLKKFFQFHSYDVVHTHLFPAQYFCSFVKKKGMKLVFTEHSTDNRRRHVWYGRMLDRWSYQMYDKVIVISDKVQDCLLQHVRGVNSVIIPNGIKLTDFYEAKPLSKAELLGTNCTDKQIVTMCARFGEGKDYKTLFRALRYLSDNVHVVCVGDGELRKEHEEYCKKEGLLERVHFLGLRKDVNRIFKTSDVLVLSSAYEGFSLSMLEAMAVGKPFVASRVSGIADLVGQCVDLFSFGDEKDLASLITRTLQDSVYREKQVRKALAFVADYDIKRVAEKHVALYKLLEK